MDKLSCGHTEEKNHIFDSLIYEDGPISYKRYSVCMKWYVFNVIFYLIILLMNVCIRKVRKVIYRVVLVIELVYFSG